MADSRSEAVAAPELERQAQLERSPVVRAVLSLVVVLAVAAMLTANMRPSYLRERLGKLTTGYTNAVGLDQNWALFAPEPRKFTLDLVARVTYADGTTQLRTVPHGDAITGAYWDYRWLKWVEYAADDSHRDLWLPAAQWFAHDAAKPGTSVRQVVLMRNERPNNPPGQKRKHGDRSSVGYYTYRVGATG